MANFGAVLLACLFVNIVTLSGVAFIGLQATTGSACQSLFAFNSFAAGALLGAAAFLMLLESSHLVESEWGGEEKESEVAWRWGAALLAGFLLPLVGEMVSDALGVENLANLLNGNNNMQVKTVEAETELVGTVGGEKEEPQGQAAAPSQVYKNINSVLFAVCFGDVLCNFVDGVLIGAAFNLCSSNNAAWAVAGGAAAHEVAQELADYVVLTSPQVGFSPFRALALNFCTGTSVVLGGLLVTWVDVQDGVLGLLLACGAGAYIYLGAVVCLPAALVGASTIENEEEEKGKVMSKARKGRLRSRRALVMFSFVLGTVAIGLVLLNHKHCGDHGHDEHDEHEEDEDHHEEEGH